MSYPFFEFKAKIPWESEKGTEMKIYFECGHCKGTASVDLDVKYETTVPHNKYMHQVRPGVHEMREDRRHMTNHNQLYGRRTR